MASPSLLAALVADILDGLRVFNSVDKLNIPEALLLARARNIVDGLRGNYSIVALAEGPERPHWETPLIQGPQSRPLGHSWSCRCDRCADARQKERA